MLFNVLVLLSKTGDIYVGALGTDPNIFSPPRPEARQINYEEADAEMNKLNSVIKAIQSQDPTKVAQVVGEELTVKVQVSPHLEPCYHHSLVSDEDGIPMAKISIDLTTSTPLTRIRVGIDAVEPLVVTTSSFILSSLSKCLPYFSELGLVLCPADESKS